MIETKKMFDELVTKANNALEHVQRHSIVTDLNRIVLCGIGYAILAVAVAVKENAKQDAVKKE